MLLSLYVCLIPFARSSDHTLNTPLYLDPSQPITRRIRLLLPSEITILIAERCHDAALCNLSAINRAHRTLLNPVLNQRKLVKGEEQLRWLKLHLTTIIDISNSKYSVFRRHYIPTWELTEEIQKYLVGREDAIRLTCKVVKIVNNGDEQLLEWIADFETKLARHRKCYRSNGTNETQTTGSGS